MYAYLKIWGFELEPNIQPDINKNLQNWISNNYPTEQTKQNQSTISYKICHKLLSKQTKIKTTEQTITETIKTKPSLKWQYNIKLKTLKLSRNIIQTQKCFNWKLLKNSSLPKPNYLRTIGVHEYHNSPKTKSSKFPKFLKIANFTLKISTYWIKVIYT